MSELPYSFHIGSNKNRKATSRNNAKNNLSNTTSLSNNGIQNHQQLSKVNNHDFRKYENNTKDSFIINDVPGWVSFISYLLYCCAFLLTLFGIINTTNESSKELPVIGKFRILK